jgi:hypothetical protein
MEWFNFGAGDVASKSYKGHLILHGDHPATLHHGITGQALADVILPDGLPVLVEGIWGPEEPDPYFADAHRALVISQDDHCRYVVHSPVFGHLRKRGTR